MDIEKLATSAIVDAVARTNCVTPYVNSGDREPIWDGYLYAYTDVSKKNEFFSGKVPVQVKGQKCNEFAESEHKYLVRVTDLQSFLKVNGTIYFVVQINDNGDKKIFYNALLPVELDNILSNCGKDKNKCTVKMDEFPTDAKKITEIILKFLKDRKDQVKVQGVDKREDIFFSKQEISWITRLRYVPVPRHHVSRIDEKKMVNDILDFSKSKSAISGIVGGIGKTELLKLVCKEVLDTCKYHYVGWIDYSGNFETDLLNSLDTQFARNNNPIDILLKLDKSHGKDMVLFVDNVEKNNDNSLEILRRLSCKVIVTTRNQTFFDFNMMYLELLSENIATKIYMTYRDQCDTRDYDIKNIVKLCGYHPLTIELVGKYAKKRKLSSKELYEELLKYEYNLEGLVDSNWNGNKEELIVTQLSKLYKLSDLSLDENTAYILKCFAILPSKPIPKLFVESIVDRENADAFDLLVDNAWISSTESTWYMHDVVKNIIKRELDITIDDCADFLQKLCKYATNIIDYNVMINSLTFLIGVTEFFTDKRNSSLLIKIYNDIGYVYQELTNYENAEKWFKKALNAISLAEKNEELILLHGLICNNIGKVLQDKITRKKYRNAVISEKEIRSLIAWYDQSLESYEVLLKNYTCNQLDIERKKLVAKHNREFSLFQSGYQKEGLDSLKEIIYEKLQIVNQFIAILLCYYSKLLDDMRYSKIPSIVNGYNSLKTLESIIIQKFDTSNNEINNMCLYMNENVSISDILERLNDYRFVFDNELIPSLVRSCDVYADCLCDYIMKLENPNEILSCLEMADKICQFALDICEKIEKVTIFEGAVWGTLSRIHYAWELKFTNVHSKEAAIDEQLTGIGILECILRESSNGQSRDPLFRAYNNMYAYTGEEEWKIKAEQIFE